MDPTTTSDGGLNGARGFHWKSVDLIARILTPLMAVVLTVTLGLVIDNQRRLIDIEARVRVIESKTLTMPPADYQRYIDAKFQALDRALTENRDVVARQLGDLHATLEEHVRVSLRR